MPEEISWGTVLLAVTLALIAAAVPVTLGALLGRKNANKKLKLEETTVILSGTDSQIKAYQDLLDRANATVERFEEIKASLESKISYQAMQINTLRTLFSQVVSRSNIVLTEAEQAVFDSTLPHYEVQKLRQKNND